MGVVGEISVLTCFQQGTAHERGKKKGGRLRVMAF